MFFYSNSRRILKVKISYGCKCALCHMEKWSSPRQVPFWFMCLLHLIPSYVQTLSFKEAKSLQDLRDHLLKMIICLLTEDYHVHPSIHPSIRSLIHPYIHLAIIFNQPSVPPSTIIIHSIQCCLVCIFPFIHLNIYHPSFSLTKHHLSLSHPSVHPTYLFILSSIHLNIHPSLPLLFQKSLTFPHLLWPSLLTPKQPFSSCREMALSLFRSQ